jgi:hypothetical protein
MSDFDKSTFTDFGKLVPGFDFLQNLTRQASADSASSQPKMPSFGHWVAPTMSVEELEKRIAELKTVQFWLDQNATALKATIQALEVQKMTLATLHDMNVNMTEMAKAFSVKLPDVSVTPAASSPLVAEPEAAERPGDAAPSPPSGVDPMQWWGALTQQFQNIAASALKEAAERQPLAASQAERPKKVKPAAPKRVRPAAKSAAKASVKAAPKAKAAAPARAPAGVRNTTGRAR